MNLRRFVLWLIGLLGLAALPPACAVDVPTPPPAVSREQVTAALAGLAVPFEENRGQSDARIAFQAHTLAGPLFVTREGELVWSLTPPPAPHSPQGAAAGHGPAPGKTRASAEKLTADKGLAATPTSTSTAAPTPVAETAAEAASAWAVVERFVGGKPKPTGAGLSPTQVNNFHGNDRSQWRSGVPIWARVSLGEVWSGVEVSLAARGKNVEKVFTIEPKADAGAIAIEVAGGILRLAPDGSLRIETSPGTSPGIVTFSAPLAWQEVDGVRKPVQVAYRVTGERGDRYGFTLGEYDQARAVVIDPLLQSTYLGGSREEYATALAVTAAGVYVAGYTWSPDFPGTAGGAQGTPGGNPQNNEDEAFVAKLSLDLRTLIQSTYPGGGS